MKKAKHCMVSPFPGMDPFLEWYLWPDVHNSFAVVIAELLAALIAPNFVARIAPYAVEDEFPNEDIGILYPNLKTTSNSAIVLALPVKVRIPTVEIRDRQSNQLITAIEILSPVNKRDPGLAPYRAKRKHLHEVGVHLLEIGLLRRGQRPFNHPYLRKNQYIVTLVRAETNRTDVWGFDIQDPMPIVPVPLRAPDADVPLDLGKVLKIIYERSLYQLSIDYNEMPPPPVFSEEEQAWMKGLLASKNL